MASKRFASMVDAIARAFGQQGRELKETSEAIYLRTPDGLVYAFFEDPQKLSPALVKRLVSSMGEDLSRLVVLGLLPLAPSSVEALEDAGASVVSGDRFHRLLEGLELTGYGEPSAPLPKAEENADRRVLPTADRLDQLMERGRTWMGWEVPAIALRFFDEAARMKPEYVPALLGAGGALVSLGAADAAESTFERVLSQSPGHLEARIGLARVTGLRGDLDGEVDELSALLKEAPGSTNTRAHLMAALVPLGRWKDLLSQVEAFLQVAPEEPYFHALGSVCFEQLKDKESALRERRAAEVLGMTPQMWSDLRENLETSEGPDAEGRKGARPSSRRRGKGGPSYGTARKGD